MERLLREIDRIEGDYTDGGTEMRGRDTGLVYAMREVRAAIRAHVPAPAPSRADDMALKRMADEYAAGFEPRLCAIVGVHYHEGLKAGQRLAPSRASIREAAEDIEERQRTLFGTSLSAGAIARILTEKLGVLAVLKHREELADEVESLRARAEEDRMENGQLAHELSDTRESLAASEKESAKWKSDHDAEFAQRARDVIDYDHAIDDAEAESARLRDALGRIGEWSDTYGAALKPGYCTADTFGEGMRAAKEQVKRLLSPRPPQEGGSGA